MAQQTVMILSEVVVGCKKVAVPRLAGHAQSQISEDSEAISLPAMPRTSPDVDCVGLSYYSDFPASMVERAARTTTYNMPTMTVQLVARSLIDHAARSVSFTFSNRRVALLLNNGMLQVGSRLFCISDVTS